MAYRMPTQTSLTELSVTHAPAEFIARKLIELARSHTRDGGEGEVIGSSASSEWGEDFSNYSDFEEHYKKLGWHKGPFSTPEVKEKVRRFWASKGVEGVPWLLERIRDEHAVEVLDAVAEIVGDAGRTEGAAIKACLDVLDRQPSEEQEDVALTALRWMAPAEGSLRDRLRATIERYLRQPDTLLQEKAVLATRALPASSTEDLFANVSPEMEDPIREIIDEERARRTLRN